LENGNILMTGFYSDRKNSQMKGIFLLEADLEKQETISVRTTDFTTSFLQLFMSERSAKRGKELTNFEVRDLIRDENGDMMFLAEYYSHTVSISQSANGAISTTDIYNYGDLMVAKIDSQGKIKWWTRVPKKQISTNNEGYYSGISYTFSNGRLNIIYNDHKSNANHVNPERLKSMEMKSAYTVLVSVDSEGKISKAPLFKSKEDNTLMIPRKSLDIGANEQIMLSQSKKRFRLCRIGIE
jgi:hypothetical protein